MSYFSHHPEKWEEIECKGVAGKLASYSPEAQKEQGGAVREEEIKAILVDIFSEMANDHKPLAKFMWTTLCDWAREEIGNEEQAYFEGFVP